MAFDMLQQKRSAHRSLPWIHSGLRCLRSMMTKSKGNAGQLPITISAIEQMVRSVFSDFELNHPDPQPQQNTIIKGSPPIGGGIGLGDTPTFTFPSMPFGFDVVGKPDGTSSQGFGSGSEEPADFTAADVGWDIDFGTMEIDTFLSLDPAQAFDFAL